MDTEKAGGNPTKADEGMTLDQLAQLEAKGQNPDAGFEAGEPKATATEQPVAKPTESKETDWKREKELAQTEIGRLNKLKSELDKLQRDATIQADIAKRLERQERMLNALGDVLSSQAIAEQPFPQEPEQEPKTNKLKETWSKIQEESAAEQLSTLLSANGLDLNDERLSYVRKASSKQDQVDRLQALLPILEKRSEPTQPSESVADIEARVRQEVLSQLGKVDVGASGSSARSSFADYARDFASGKIGRDEYRDARKKYGID